MFKKLGENFNITKADLRTQESVMSDPEIQERFSKFAGELKKIAPKANDFLYFSAIMMHAAEAALINEQGELKKDAQGQDLVANWERNGESVKWICSDPNVKPYKNNNGDIFSEAELLKAYKKWVGKPLCLDHKSSSVDHIRGVIVDTYYDHKMRRVVALCALDKKNYPSLARQVETGYATCVSMGTGVGRAICSDCGRVARTEQDFCHHMQTRSCYGEINEELNPIELSIVVNGADPKAKIRHIVAAHNAIAKYVSMKEDEFSKFSGDNQKLLNITDGLNKVLEQIEDLKQEIKSLNNELEETEELENEKENVNDEDLTKAASFDMSIIHDINSQLNKISEKINKLSTHEAIKMTDIEKKSYFQGTEEPAVGQVKYPKEDADSVRNNLDKQMTGQMNTGPVDGMHPGYESFGETEEARKRRLQRLAEEEKAALRREAALELAQEKLAYFQGTEEPTPGKPKYPKEDAESIRNKEDKQMTGQPPFPGVGDVDGLHPSPASVSEKDELKRKQMLSRAKYVAKLIKAMDSQGKDSLGNSRWDIYARSEGSKDRLVFSATVDELTHGNSELLGHGVITEQFGQKLLAKVRSEGLEKLAASLKVAQEMPAPAAPAMPAMPAMPAAPAMPEEPVKDEGGSGDPAENLDELLDDTETNLVELRKGIEALTGTSDNELKEFEGLADQGALSPVTSGLINNAKKLAFALAKSMKNTASELSVAKDELEMAKHVLSNKLSSTQRKQALDMTKQSMENAKNLLSKSYQCMDNFNQLAFGMEVLVKKASQEANMVKMAQDPTAGVVGKVYQKGDPFMPLDAVPGVPYQPKADAPKAVSAPKPSAKPASRPKPSKKDPNKLTPQELENLHRARPGRAELMDPMLEGYSNKALTTDHKAPQGQGASGQDTVKTVNFDKAKADDQVDEHELKMSADGTLEGSPEEMGKVLKQKDASEEFDLSTKAGRMAWRAKQAKDLQFSKILNDAHKGGTTLKFDMKPTGDMAKVDTLEEVQKAVKDVALKEVSVKTKKAAESIQKQVLAGAISADKVDELASFGVDKDAINYWKQFYGEAKDSAAKEFAKELTSDHEKAKKAESLEVERVRMKRAYELASEMQERGVIEGNKVAREEFVDAVLKLNDEGFESYAQMLNRMPSKTAANKFPQVKGASFFSDEEKSEEFGSTDLGAQFAAAFAGRKY